MAAPRRPGTGSRQRFFAAEHRVIVPLTVREILDEEIARKLA